MNWLLLSHEVLCVILALCIFSRSVRSSDEVLIIIRLAFWAMWTATLMGIIAPLVWGYVPHPVEVAMLSGFTMVQYSTSVHWTGGVPSQFLRKKFRPTRRQSDLSFAQTTN
jgi:hypothetical protein